MRPVAFTVRIRHDDAPVRTRLAWRDAVALALLHPGVVAARAEHLAALPVALDAGLGPGRLAPEEDGLVVVDLPTRTILAHEPGPFAGTCPGWLVVDAAAGRHGAEARLSLALLAADGRLALPLGPPDAGRARVETPTDLDAAALRIRELELEDAAILADVSPWLVERFPFDGAGARAMRDRLSAIGFPLDAGERDAWERWALARDEDDEGERRDVAAAA